jgi:hypothetical protein
MPADPAAVETPNPVPAAVASSPAPAPAASPIPAAAPAAPAAAPAPPAAAAEPGKEAAKEGVKAIPSLIGDKAAEAKDGDKAPPQPEVAPVYDLKLPDGIEVDAPVMDKAKDIFAKGKVAPEVAQELATLYGEQLQTAAEVMLHRQIEVWNDTIRTQQQAVMDDPEIGGDKFPAIKRQIEDGLQTIFGVNERTPADAPARIQHEEALEALKYTGAGSFLPIIRLLAKATKPHSEGGPVQGSAPPAPKRTLAERLYPPKAAE